MKPATREAYGELANAAFDNAMRLLDDAKFLYSGGRFQRAFALGELALEEFAKFIIVKGYVNGWATDESLKKFGGIQKVIRSHYPKQATSLFFHALKNSDDFLGPLVVGLAWNATMEAREKGERGEEIFDLMERYKQNSLYVDLIDGKVVTPAGQIGQSQAEQMLGDIDKALPLYQKLLAADGEQFGKLLSLAKPEK